MCRLRICATILVTCSRTWQSSYGHSIVIAGAEMADIFGVWDVEASLLPMVLGIVVAVDIIVIKTETNIIVAIGVKIFPVIF